MKLRQAKKILSRLVSRGYRAGSAWWDIYDLLTLARAERRMRAAWRARRDKSHPCVGPTARRDGRRYDTLTDEWFWANRLRSVAIRVRAIRGDDS